MSANIMWVYSTIPIGVYRMTVFWHEWKIMMDGVSERNVRDVDFDK